MLPRRVREFLTTRGVSCFFADRSLLKLGRGAYRRVIEEALEAAEHMVVVASSREHALKVAGFAPGEDFVLEEAPLEFHPLA